MENIISSSEVAGVDLQPANACKEPDSKCRSSSKRRSKTRSKVWEKVAWFTRKAKSNRENKAESLEEAGKGVKSSSLSVLRSEEQEVPELNSAGIKLNSSYKTKTKSGIRKTRSFNYLRRKKFKHFASDASSSLQEGNNKENADPTSTSCQTATGNFHDFAGFGRKCSNTTASSTLLVSEMAKQMSSKQEEYLKGSVRSSLSLPLSLLSLNERPAPDVCSPSCQGLLCGCKTKNKSFSGPNYNSWPRKKRLLAANHSYEAFSPPQKQKRICGIRKTATFSGFDSSKLCLKEFKPVGSEPRMGKSAPLLCGTNQIKNQNGLTIGVIHFFKSSGNNYSIVGKGGCIPRAILPNDVKDFDVCSECSIKRTKDTNTDIDVVGNIGISDALHSNSCLDAERCDANEGLSSTLQSDLLKNEFFAEKEQCSGENRDNIESISKDLDESANTCAIVSMKECFMVEDPFNEVPSPTLQNLITASQHQENISQPDTLKKDIHQLSESLHSSSDSGQIILESQEIISSSDASALDSVHLNLLNEICATDKRTAYTKLGMISEIPDSLAIGNTENIESPKEYDKHSMAQTKETPESSQASETRIYCIKIEDQVTDFSKEGRIDFQAQSKLQSPSSLSDLIIEDLKDSTCVKENPLSQSEDNSNTSETLCTMTNGSAPESEEKDETSAAEKNTFGDSLLPSDMATSDKGKSISKDGNILSKVESVNSNFSSRVSLKSSGENKIPENKNKDIIGSCLQQTRRIVLKQGKPTVDGPHFKHQTETILNWFSEFNDEQKNILIKKLLEQCQLPQMHLLSVIMEPVLHKTCPSNCQDMLAWLPHTVTNAIMSYLDPESFCRCSQVNRFWNSLASNPLIWKGLCKSNEWQLSRKTEEKQLLLYTLPCSTVQWKKMFAERYLLRKNWLNGRCKVRTFEGHTQGISCVQFDDTRIVSGSTDKTIRVWDLSRDDSHAVLALAGHSGTVRCLNLNGNRLVSGSVDRSIKVWDLSFESYWSGASCKVTMVGHMHTVRCLQVDDEKVVSGSYDKTLKVWDLKTGQCKLTLRGHNAAVLCVQFDDNKIVSGSYDNTIKVWGLDEGECLMTLAGHHDAVTCLNLTQDGRKVISGSLDHNLKFWDLATGKCIGTLDWIRSEGHTGVIRCLQSDSWRIVSAGDDKTLKMWSLETGQRLLTLRCHTDGVTCLQFNDYRIVSGSYDKTVKVWNFSPEHAFLNSS